VAGTTFTLESVLDVPDQTKERRAPAHEPGPVVEAHLRMTTAGQPDDGWEILGTQFRDATGNRLQWLGRRTNRRTPGERLAEMAFPLFPGEEAGKLGVVWLRSKGIDTNDVVELKEVPLLRTNSQSARYAMSTRFGMISVSVQMNEVYDDFSVSVINGTPRAGDIAAAGTRWFFPVEAKDNLGRTYAFADAAVDVSSLHRVTIRAGAKTVDLKLAAPQVVFVEYTLGRESILPAETKRK
jgi:hypothetical protein